MILVKINCILFICERGSFLTSKKQYYFHCVEKKHQKYVARFLDFANFQDVKVNIECLKNKSFVPQNNIDEGMVLSDDVRDANEAKFIESNSSSDDVKDLNQ